MNAITAALASDSFAPAAKRVANNARFASRRMAAAIRRGALSRGTLLGWRHRLDRYRAKGDWLSAADFLREYGPGIDSYCRPARRLAA